MNESIAHIFAQQVFYQLLGSAILFLVIAKCTYKSYLKMCDKRQEYITESINSATEANQEAQKELKEVESLKKEAAIQREKIIDEAKEIANQERDEIVSNAKKQAQEIMVQAQKNIESQEEKAKQELMNDVYDYVQLVSEKYIKEQVDQKVEQDLINNAIDQVENNE